MQRAKGNSHSTSRFWLLCVLVLLSNSLKAQVVAELDRAQSRALFSQNENYAVIVGVNRYDYVAGLQYAVHDAEQLSALLEEQGYQVETLLDYEASPRRILSSLKRAARLATQDGRLHQGNVLFAFSGHGFRDEQENYLAMPETDPADLSGTALPLREITTMLSSSKVRQRVLFIDACRNVPGMKSIDSKQSGFEPDDEAEGLAILYSTGSGSLSWEDGQLGNGVFTHYLLQGLSGDAVDADGLVTFDKLRRYVSGAVKRHVSERFRQVQIPYIGGERTGEFVLARGEVPRRLAPNVIERALSLTRRQWQEVQSALNQSGYPVGAADGVPGQRTREGIAGWQRAQGSVATGYLTGSQRDELMASLVIVQEVSATSAQTSPPEPTRRSFEPEMVLIEGGRFEMGTRSGGSDDERPVRQVSVKSFELGRYEVTAREWREFVERSGYRTDAERDVGEKGCWSETSQKGKFGWVGGRSWKDPGFVQGEDHPVVCVSWSDAKAYVEWLSKETGKEYRLPSEAEWEYAVRAGSKSNYHFGDEESRLCEYGNVGDETAKKTYGHWTVAGCVDGYVYTSPVGSFKENGNGLRDMHGNVLEWVEDCWHESYEGAPADGSAWIQGGECGRRVLRGGSWCNAPDYLRSAIRSWYNASYRLDIMGFRVSRTLTP